MKATTTMTEVLSTEGVKLHEKECCVCYERFINISCGKLCDLYEKLVEEDEKYNEIIDWETTCLCYDDRFECLTCKNLVCYGCIKKMPDPDAIKRIDIFNYNNYFQDYMDDSGRITCPICRTKDFRLKIQGRLKGYCGARGGILPEELIYDIKNISNNQTKTAFKI